MTVGSLIPTAIDRVVTVAQGNSFEVFDGPGVTDDRIAAALFVGWSDPDSEEYDEAATTNLTWAWLGHQQQTEVAFISCAAEAWNGNADQQDARNTVFGIVNVLGDAFVADPSLGLQASPVDGINNFQVMGIQNLSLLQNQEDNGAFARLRFTIEIHGRVH